MPESNPAAAPSKSQIFLVRLRSTVVLWTIIGGAIASGIGWVIAAVVAGFGVLTAVEYARMEHDDAGFRPHAVLAVTLSILYWVTACWQIMLRHAEPPWWVDAAVLVGKVEVHSISTPSTDRVRSATSACQVTPPSCLRYPKAGRRP